VARPGVFAVDGDTSLLEGVALAGGILETGDIEGAYVIRGAKLLPVSLGDILLRGDTSRNVYMQNGDLVYVPDKADWKVYVLGEVKRPGIVPMGGRGLSLADALAHVGGVDPLYADKNVIRVFRGSWQAPRAYTLSVEDVYRSGAGIALKPGDRIIVAPRGLANWNRAATLLLPFIQTALTATTVGVAVSD
jgi:polysaccharide export outer membrane protein